MDNLNLNQLKTKWKTNAEAYKTLEIGSGVHSFVSDMLESKELFNLSKTPKYQRLGTFTHDAVLGKEGRPDFILYIDNEVTIPVEAKCYTRINEGITQLQRYQLDYSKQYGILTDGNEWRFYRATTYSKFTIDEILDNPAEFLSFWNDYIKPEHYYIQLFSPSGQRNLFEEKMDLNDAENRKIFFDDTTKLIGKFKAKMKSIGVFDNVSEKLQVEISYAYLIQYILYKVLIDNGFKVFKEKFDYFLKQIRRSLEDNDFFSDVFVIIRDISTFISTKIYKPFSKEQEQIDKHLIKKLDIPFIVELNDIAPWLDIFIYINKYHFANLKNEIFGFIYENYLKDLYEDKNKGQYFTDPEVVNLMLEEMGYVPQELKKNSDKWSIIDPACGAGTFLYSAVDAILRCFPEQLSQNEAQKIEQLISKNIFGLDIEEFPLYLAEMNILMRLLPLIINDDYENPMTEKIKVFKTKDSISEFLDAGIGAVNPEIDYPTLFSKTHLGYDSFMRDDKNLQEMIESMQGHNGERMRFDFVVGNPPYVGLNECYKDDVPFAAYMRGKNTDGTKNADKKLYMNDIYGVNLHSIPNNAKKGRPNPNLYAFFIALGLSLLKKGGKMCYIIPQNMLTTGDYDVLRYHLAKNTTIEKLLTFDGNLFTGRGLQQKRPIATSSLIFVVKKEIPEKNHKVEIINYKPYFTKQGESFKVYFKGRHRNKAKHILQSELLENVENWNFIKQNQDKIKFFRKYNKNTDNIDCYYNHTLAAKKFHSNFYFDGGYSIDEKLILQEKSDYIYPKTNNKYFCIREIKGYWQNVRNGDLPNRIALRQGNQEYKLLDSKYKILWTHTNAKRFFYTDKPVIWARNQFNAIGSDNKNEILYLFALLNSELNFSVLRRKLKNENEKNFTLAIKSIKQFIRIPKITPENQAIKDKIIIQTEKMLDLEKVTLKDLADFKDLMVQRFDNVEVKENNLILAFNKKEFSCKIEKGKENFVKKLILEKYFDNGLIFNRESVTLQELKNLEAIDFEMQTELKNHIDNLVFALYFDDDTKI
ncbi:MAG: N-6 DNA methylase [Lentimicrobiaceae bacterium]|nr:N-6 DNA methylase [Lentimicrobiaceae bacterium]